MENEFKKALVLEYVTVGYNVLEAAASLAAGALASSIALTGFGLDSIVESLSGCVLIWRLKKHGRASKRKEANIERRAVWLVAASFLILGLYVLAESVRKIAEKETAGPSLFGIGIAAVSAVIMPFLGRAKYRLGKRMGLESLVADAKETFVCFGLSVALLIGLVSRAAFGFRLADPIMGLVIVLFLFKEGFELLFGETSAQEKG